MDPIGCGLWTSGLVTGMGIPGARSAGLEEPVEEVAEDMKLSLAGGEPEGSAKADGNEFLAGAPSIGPHGERF